MGITKKDRCSRKTNHRTEEDYLHILNSQIGLVMFLASCEYREDGPLGKTDYDFMYTKLTPTRLAPISSLVENICQKFDLSYPAKGDVSSKEHSFENWYEKKITELGLEKKHSADVIFSKIARG